MRVTVMMLLMLISAGCGGGDSPPLGTVSGVITLDGAPVAEAQVTFQPTEGGRGSTGLTDAAGKYQLAYRAGEMGAIVGPHTVSITTARRGSRDKDSKQADIPERIPNSYNGQSTLKADVEPGSHTIDFDLDSKAKVVETKKSFSGKTAGVRH